jgi:hypothetical protein
MLFEYNLSKTANPNTSTFYIIGVIMLLGGIVKLISEISSESGDGFFRILLYIVTTLGGVGFLIIANRSKNSQKDTVKYSIQISDEKIITKYGNDGKVKEMLTSEISKIDFNSKDIHISSKDNSKIVVDLGLISPEKKKKELTKVLESILENK